MSLDESSAPGILTIDLSALAANYGTFKRQTRAGCDVAAVVKADSYGLEVSRVIAALENENCPFYYVATPEEALKIRPLTKRPVAVLDGLFPDMADFYIDHHLMPVLNRYEEITAWHQACKAREIALPAIIHFDTGMNRLGLGPEETERFIAEKDRFDHILIEKIMSHFACADEPGHALTPAQAKRFDEISRHFPQAQKSLCNSYGTFAQPDYHYDEVRAGMALYGLNPLPAQENPVKPVVSLEARILQTRPVKKGMNAGYGATYRFEKDTALATVAIGYADGFLRSLGNKGTLYLRGQPCPIRGRVSMDLTTIEVGHLDPLPQVGDMAEILGPHQSADDLAADAGTIGYEILTSLGLRYQRIYI